MSQVDSRSFVPYIITFVVSFVLLFTAILFMQNGTTLHVKMKESSGALLSPKVYYASKDQHFSEQKSAPAYKVKNDIYYFHLPKSSQIHYLRLDPTSRADKTITLEDISVEQYNWFKVSKANISIVPQEKVQINNSRKKKHALTFTTTGSDPQLRFKLEHLLFSKSHDYHPMGLLIALMLALIVSFVLSVYFNAEHTQNLDAKMILYTLFLLFAVFKVVYYKDHVKFGYPPDETMHFAYIKYVHHHHALVPDFKQMPHYLSHPSLYYEIMDIVYDEKASMHQNVENFRSLSMLIYLFTFLLILYLGFSAKLSTLGHFVYLSIISSIPMHSYLGASITNDTLAMFGGIIFILGLKRLIEHTYTTSTYMLLASGITIAYFSKLTAALLIFFALLYFLLRMFFTKEWIKFTKVDVTIVLLTLVPILYYQLSIMFSYHALVPTYNVTHPEAYLKSGFYIQEQYRQHLTPYEWFERMLHYIQGGWFGIHSHHSITKAHIVGFIGLLLAHILAFIALLFNCPKENKSYCIVGKMTLLAILSVQVVQYFFSYKAHLNAGYMGGLQPRYLLPFMFAFAIMASLFVERFKQYFLFTIVIILMCMHALYSDFFYFLQYYH